MGVPIRHVLDAAATIVTIAAASMIIRGIVRAPAPPDTRQASPMRLTGVEEVNFTGSPTLGDPAAPVALVVYSDFDCPFCRKFAAESLPRLRDGLVREGKVLLVFKHLPLPQIHPTAQAKARAADCALKQGRFWDAHDLLFSGPVRKDAAQVVRGIQGLDQRLFDACFTGSTGEAVNRDVADAERHGIRATPTLLFGRLTSGRSINVTRREGGAVPFDALRVMVQQLVEDTRGQK